MRPDESGVYLPGLPTFEGKLAAHSWSDQLRTMLDRIEPDPGLSEARADRLGRETRPVLDAAKAFFFRSSYQSAVANDTSG